MSEIHGGSRTNQMRHEVSLQSFFKVLTLLKKQKSPYPPQTQIKVQLEEIVMVFCLN